MSDDPQLTMDDYLWTAALARARLFGDRNTADVAVANMDPARSMVAAINILVSHLRATAAAVGAEPQMLLQAVLDGLQPTQDEGDEDYDQNDETGS